jgi:hypothetical protein
MATQFPEPSSPRPVARVVANNSDGHPCAQTIQRPIRHRHHPTSRPTPMPAQWLCCPILQSSRLRQRNRLADGRFCVESLRDVEEWKSVAARRSCRHSSGHRTSGALHKNPRLHNNSGGCTKSPSEWLLPWRQPLERFQECRSERGRLIAGARKSSTLQAGRLLSLRNRCMSFGRLCTTEPSCTTKRRSAEQIDWHRSSADEPSESISPRQHCAENSACDCACGSDATPNKHCICHGRTLGRVWTRIDAQTEYDPSDNADRRTINN